MRIGVNTFIWLPPFQTSPNRNLVDHGAYGPGRDISDLDPNVRPETLAYIVRLVRLAAELGADVVALLLEAGLDAARGGVNESMTTSPVYLWRPLAPDQETFAGEGLRILRASLGSDVIGQGVLLLRKVICHSRNKHSATTGSWSEAHDPSGTTKAEASNASETNT